MLRAKFVLFPLLCALPTIDGQDPDKERLDGDVAKIIKEVNEETERFRLYNACRPMRFSVIPLPTSDDTTIGQLRQIVREIQQAEATAKSRLRDTRLYTENHAKADFASLDVAITLTYYPAAYNINIAYRKWLTDEFGNCGSALTWESFGSGVDLESVLSEKLDEFLAMYLRVNEEACK